MSNLKSIQGEKIKHLTLDVSEEIITKHLEPFYEKNKIDGETLERFIVRAVTSQAINAAAQHDCNVLREAMEKELATQATDRIDQAKTTAKELFGK